MDQRFNQEILLKLKRKRKKRIWKRILCAMMCLVVFCTTYMLILPAITKETKTYCGNNLHIHNKTCYSDPTADVETDKIWMATLPLTDGVSKQNIVKIAKSQLGYAESSNNYRVDDEGNTKGYTRYGAWYGSPYDDWDATFVAFCIRYAGVNYPYDASAQEWAKTLEQSGLFKPPSEYVPKSGDIVFFDYEQDQTIDRVGLVESIENTKIITIEGDSTNRVDQNTYDLFDKNIVGYGVVEVENIQSDTELDKQQDGALGYRDALAELVTATESKNKENTKQSSKSSAVGISTYALRGASATSQVQSRASPLSLEPYVNTVNMYDDDGNLIPSGSLVTEGDLIEFKIEYTITGQQLGVMNGNDVTVKSDTLEYTLPRIFEMVQSDSGNIHNNAGQVVGNYVIDSETGKITLTFTQNYVEQNAQGMQIHGYISCFSVVKKVTELDDEQQDFKFTDNIILGVTIEEKDEAVGDLTLEKQKVSVDGDEIVYELRVTSDEGTKGSVTISDKMSAGLTFVEGLGVWRGNGSSVSNVSFRPSNDKSSFTLTLPEMSAGGSYVVRYRCKADVKLLDSDMTVTNTATVTGKDSHDKDLEDEVTVDHNFDVIKKTGEANDDGTITWKITINQAKLDISGWRLEDILAGKSYTGRVTINDSDGNVVARSVTLPYTFPSGSNKTYVITYTTKHTIAEGDRINNRAVLSYDGTDVDAEHNVGLGTPITKTGEAGEVIQDDDGNYLVPLNWTVTVDTTNSAIAAGEYFYDKMNGAYHTAEMYMTYDQLMAALRAVEAELNRVGSSVRRVYVEGYAEGYSTGAYYGQTYTMDDLENDPKCKDYLYERFTVTLGKEVPQGNILTFSYQTYGIFPNNIVADQDFKNCFNISENYEVEAVVKFTSGTLKATKTALSYYDPSIPNQQWHWENTDWNGVEGTSRFEYEKLHDSYLAWSIELSIPPGYTNPDNITIYEDLPDGVTVRKLGMPFYNSKPIQYLQLQNIQVGQTYEWTFTIYPVDQYDIHEPYRTGGEDVTILVKVTDEGDLEIIMPGKLLRLMGDLAKRYGQVEWYSYLFIYTQINDDFEWTPRSQDSHVYVNSFQNRFTITDEEGDVVDIGSQNQIITKDESEGVIRKKAAIDNNNIITYTVILNAYSRDMVKNSSTLYVHDELTYDSTESDPLRVRMVPGSLKLYEIRLASDGSYTKLKEIDVNYKYEENSTPKGDVTSWMHTIDMTVPDDKALLLEYSYKADGNKNATHDILNSCSISGVGESSLDGDHKLEIEVKDATAQADTKGIVLYKVDSDSDGIFLDKAKFNIYIWNKEQNKYILVHHPENGGSDFVTDSKGMIVLDTSTMATEQFAYNTAYYIVEVESPDGYYLGPEPYYFYIANDNKVAYPECIPRGFTGAALVSGDIIYRKNINELTKINVEKYWRDYDGSEISVSGQEVPSITIELWQMLEGDPNSAKRYGTYTMTPDEDGNWNFTITGLPKATRNADGTKGTDYLYYIKEAYGGGYVLESAQNNDGINSGTIKLVNRKKEGYLLPKTGGIGTKVFTMAGTILVLISIPLLIINRKKRRKEDDYSP